MHVFVGGLSICNDVMFIFILFFYAGSARNLPGNGSPEPPPPPPRNHDPNNSGSTANDSKESNEISEAECDRDMAMNNRASYGGTRFGFFVFFFFFCDVVGEEFERENGLATGVGGLATREGNKMDAHSVASIFVETFCGKLSLACPA